MSRKGVKFSGKVTPLFDSMLVLHQVPEGEDSEQPTKPQPTPSRTQPSIGDQPPETSSSHATTQDSSDSLEGTNGNKGDQVQIPRDSPLSGGHTSDRAEGALNLHKLYVLCTNLSNIVLALESIKDAQAAEISALKSRIKKLEKKCKPSISHHRAWLKNHGMKYMETEEAINEGRQSGETKEVKLTDDTEVVEDKGSGDKGGNIEELVSTARPEVSTARPDIDDARQEDSMKEEKAKEKGVSFKDIEDSSRPKRSILTLKPLPTIDPKDKGKSVLEEPELIKKMTRRDFDAAQIARDAEIARQLQVDLQAKLQQEEREEYTIEERAKFLAETIVAQRKFRAAQRSAEIRSRPPTKSQLRNLMMTYLKNMGGYKHSQLKAKSFEEIKGMYERQKKSVQDFVPIGSAKEEELIKKMNEKATDEDTSNKEKVLEEPDSTKVEVKQEGHEDSTRKRPGRRLKMKATKKSKRQKTDSDLEEEEQLKAFLMIVPDEEGIIDYEVLEKRFPIINWESKFYEFDRHGAECIYYRIFRSDGSSRWIKTFSEMVTRFDRLDLEELYNLVMKRFETTTPEGVDLVLWGDLRTMFDANAEDELWQNQERWNLKSWDLYENCGVHTLILEDGTEIHMLAERKYPLTKETLERMLSLRLVAGTASEDAYTLLRFIQKQIDEYGSHDGGEKDL
ncbi:hypothetical protein Tco_0577709 [Tanacetum coccineum]